MGSNKFLIIAFAIVSALALSLVGVSASEMIYAETLEVVSPSEDFPLEREVELETDSVLRATAETFPAVPLLENNFYSYEITVVQLPYYAGRLTNIFSIAIYDTDGSYCFGLSTGEGFDFWRGTVGESSVTVSWGHGSGSSFTIASRDGSSVRDYTVVFTASTSTFTLGSSTLNGTLVTSDPVAELNTSIWSVGDALITFVMSSWVVLLPLSCWLVVLCIGAIRKLVKGV